MAVSFFFEVVKNVSLTSWNCIEGQCNISCDGTIIICNTCCRLNCFHHWVNIM